MSENHTEVVRCPDCLIQYYKALGFNNVPHLKGKRTHERSGRECLRRQINNLKEENKRLRAEFSDKLTQSPLEMIRAKCEQYWNEPNTLCPEEMHNILEFIHQLTRCAERSANNV